MNQKPLFAVLLLAAFSLIAIAQEPVPAVAPAPAAAAPAPSAPDAVPAADQPAAADASPAQSPLGDTPTPPPGKRLCDMKGKGMMGGHGMGGPGMGGAKGCGCPGHKGCTCGHSGGGHGAMHQDVVQRLDLIEARLAKIESMLESLMRR